jgi:hypothetical protein
MRWYTRDWTNSNRGWGEYSNRDRILLPLRIQDDMARTRGYSLFFFFFFAVLGSELRAYTLSHSTNPFLCWVFSR